MSRRAMLKGIRSPEIRQLTRSALDAGWSASVKGSGHLCLMAPDGRRVYTSVTSDGGARALRNTLAALRRAGLSIPHSGGTG